MKIYLQTLVLIKLLLEFISEIKIEVIQVEKLYCIAFFLVIFLLEYNALYLWTLVLSPCSIFSLNFSQKNPARVRWGNLE